jgi:hypothetical protein
MYDKYQLVGTIGRELVSLLETGGFKACTPQPNGVYRPGVSNAGFMVPDFSHRYAALASGVGTLGYSGNVLVEGHWSTVFLGSVITEAELSPDQPLPENLCDDCRICTTVCALGFMDPKHEQTSVLGGQQYACSKKGNHGRCGLVCAGLVGLSRNGKWSTWATLRYKVGESDESLQQAFEAAVSDPDAEYILPHIFSENIASGVLARSREKTQPTCCNCVLVCSGPKQKRQQLRKLLHSSGVVVRDRDGVEQAVNPEQLDPLFTRTF